MITNLLQCFEDTIVNKAFSVAIIHNDQEICYKDLKISAYQVGTFLLDKVDFVNNTPIAVFLPKEINTLVADIGIMYSSNPFMKYCCAVQRYAKKEIVLYYENDSKLNVKEFRAKNSKVFLACMISFVFIRMEALPRNTNGKTDRLLLKIKANRKLGEVKCNLRLSSYERRVA